MPIAQEEVQNNVAPQPINPNEFLANFAQFFPQMVEFFSNPENLQIFSDPVFNGQIPGAQDPNNVGAGVGAENGEVPPQPIAAEANIDNEIPPPPPEDEDSGDDSGDESGDDGPSTASQIGNFAGDLITGSDGAGDLIGAGVGFIEDTFFR